MNGENINNSDVNNVDSGWEAINKEAETVEKAKKNPVFKKAMLGVALALGIGVAAFTAGCGSKEGPANSQAVEQSVEAKDGIFHYDTCADYAKDFFEGDYDYYTSDKCNRSYVCFHYNDSATSSTDEVCFLKGFTDSDWKVTDKYSRLKEYEGKKINELAFSWQDDGGTYEAFDEDCDGYMECIMRTKGKENTQIWFDEQSDKVSTASQTKQLLDKSPSGNHKYSEIK